MLYPVEFSHIGHENVNKEGARTSNVTARRWKPLITLTVCIVAVSQMMIFGSVPT